MCESSPDEINITTEFMDCATDQNMSEKLQSNICSLTFPENGDNLEISPGQLKGLISKADSHIAGYIIASCAIVICLFGILGNVLNIKTFIMMGVKDGITAIFLSISCSDLGFVILTCIRNSFTFVISSERSAEEWSLPFIDPTVIVYYSDNLAFIMYTITVLTSGMLAVVRCMGVAKPLYFRKAFTLRRVFRYLVLIYLFPICCQSAVFYHMGVRKRYHPVFNNSRYMIWLSSDRERVKDVVRLILSSIMPLVIETIVVICISVMVYKLRKTVQFRTESAIPNSGGGQVGVGPTRLPGKERRVVKQIVLILTIMVILNIHGIINSFLTAIDSRFDHGKQFERVFSLMHQVKSVFESLNASLNILVYYYYNPKFRALCLSCKMGY